MFFLTNLNKNIRIFFGSYCLETLQFSYFHFSGRVHWLWVINLHTTLCLYYCPIERTFWGCLIILHVWVPPQKLSGVLSERSNWCSYETNHSKVKIMFFPLKYVYFHLPNCFLLVLQRLIWMIFLGWGTYCTHERVSKQTSEQVYKYMFTVWAWNCIWKLRSILSLSCELVSDQQLMHLTSFKNYQWKERCPEVIQYSSWSVARVKWLTV